MKQLMIVLALTLTMLSCNVEDDIQQSGDVVIKLDFAPTFFTDYQAGISFGKEAVNLPTISTVRFKVFDNNTKELIFEQSYGSPPASIIIPSLSTGSYKFTATTGSFPFHNIGGQVMLSTDNKRSDETTYYGEIDQNIIVGDNNINLTMSNISSNISIIMENAISFDNGYRVKAYAQMNLDYSMLYPNTGEVVISSYQGIGNYQQFKVGTEFSSTFRTEHYYVLWPKISVILLTLIDPDGNIINDITVEVTDPFTLQPSEKLTIHVDVERFRQYAGGQTLSVMWNELIWVDAQNIYLP